MTTKVAVIGAAGRMGATVCEAIEGADDMELVGRFDAGDDLGDALPQPDQASHESPGPSRSGALGVEAQRRSPGGSAPAERAEAGGDRGRDEHDDEEVHPQGEERDGHDDGGHPRVDHQPVGAPERLRQQQPRQQRDG